MTTATNSSQDNNIGIVRAFAPSDSSNDAANVNSNASIQIRAGVNGNSIRRASPPPRTTTMILPKLPASLLTLAPTIQKRDTFNAASKCVIVPPMMGSNDAAAAAAAAAHLSSSQHAPQQSQTAVPYPFSLPHPSQLQASTATPATAATISASMPATTSTHHPSATTFAFHHPATNPMTSNHAMPGLGNNVPTWNRWTPPFFRHRKLRSGKWTREEEAYADRLIEMFEKGLCADCEMGVTLRSYLSQKLHCAPMRISKKFAGQGIGKLAYKQQPSQDATVLSPAQVAQLKEATQGAESNFYQAVSVDLDFMTQQPFWGIPGTAAPVLLPPMMPAQGSGFNFALPAPANASSVPTAIGAFNLPCLVPTQNPQQFFSALPTSIQGQIQAAALPQMVMPNGSALVPPPNMPSLLPFLAPVPGVDPVEPQQTASSTINCGTLDGSNPVSNATAAADPQPSWGTTTGVPLGQVIQRASSQAPPPPTLLGPSEACEKRVNPQLSPHRHTQGQKLMDVMQEQMLIDQHHSNVEMPDFLSGFDRVALKFKPEQQEQKLEAAFVGHVPTMTPETMASLQCSPPLTSRSFDDFHQFMGSEDLGPLSDAAEATRQLSSSGQGANYFDNSSLFTNRGVQNHGIEMDNTGLFSGESYAVFAQESAMAASQHGAYFPTAQQLVSVLSNSSDAPANRNRAHSFDVDGVVHQLSKVVPANNNVTFNDSKQRELMSMMQQQQYGVALSSGSLDIEPKNKRKRTSHPTLSSTKVTRSNAAARTGAVVSETSAAETEERASSTSSDESSGDDDRTGMRKSSKSNNEYDRSFLYGMLTENTQATTQYSTHY